MEQMGLLLIVGIKTGASTQIARIHTNCFSSYATNCGRWPTIWDLLPNRASNPFVRSPEGAELLANGSSTFLTLASSEARAWTPAKTPVVHARKLAGLQAHQRWKANPLIWNTA